MNKVYQMPSEAEIKRWKKEYGTLHKLTVKVPGENDAICIVRAPKVSDLTYSVKKGEGDKFKIGLAQLNNCWLSGDERIRTKFAFQKAASEQMGKIFEVYPSIVETVEVTVELIEKFKSQGVTKELISTIQSDGSVRRVEITIGSKPVLELVDGEEKDTREKIEAFFRSPDLKIKEEADLMSEPLDQGLVFINQSFLAGDARFKDHSDENIAFASYMSGLSLIERFTTEVEKL